MQDLVTRSMVAVARLGGVVEEVVVVAKQIVPVPVPDY